MPERAGNGSCTLTVNNLEAVIAHVASLGIDTGEQPSGEKVKTLMIVDPDGNHIAFAQVLNGGMAR